MDSFTKGEIPGGDHPEDKLGLTETPRQMLERKRNQLAFELKSLSTQVYAYSEALTANRRDVTDANRKEIENALEATLQEIGQLLKELEKTEAELEGLDSRS